MSAMSPEDITNTPIQELVDFVVEKGKNRFYDPDATANLLQTAVRDSYRLDKALKHQHKRALALTAGKLVRLVYALLRNK